jgi:hypothetical protein
MDNADYIVNFRKARAKVKEFGLEPTLIELVHLKRIVLESMADYERTKCPYNSFNIDAEAAARFFNEIYGWGAGVPFSALHTCADECQIEEYLQKRQEEMHLP